MVYYSIMPLSLIILLLPGVSLLASAAGAGSPDLPPCPSSPNCVSSLDPDPDRRVDPIPFQGSDEEAREAIERVVRSFPRSTVVVSSKGYVRTEFRSRLGFVDDVEFRIDGAAGTIHLRSASRSGYWDFGVNRRRVEAIRKAFRDAEHGRRRGVPGRIRNGLHRGVPGADGASIRSADPQRFQDIPLRFFVRFFANHRFLEKKGNPPGV